jgi:hypothetical protein
MKIFVNYRRDDSMDVAGRIYDRLVAHFGTDSVFKDVDSIPLGVDFRHHIRQAVASCDVFLAVIGSDWLSTCTREGCRRLDDESDFVRLEIAAALERKSLFIPLLVRGASIPRPDELPAQIRDLAFRNGTPIRSDPDFHRDISRLIDFLEKEALARSESDKPQHFTEQSGEEHDSLEADSLSSGRESPSHKSGVPFLIIGSGPEEGREFALVKDRIIMGRGQDCDIVLNDPFLARNHAQLIRQAKEYFLEDLDSKNGTFLNGQNIHGRVVLREGDRIHAGKFILVYHSSRTL